MNSSRDRRDRRDLWVRSVGDALSPVTGRNWPLPHSKEDGQAAQTAREEVKRNGSGKRSASDRQ